MKHTTDSHTIRHRLTFTPTEVLDGLTLLYPDTFSDLDEKRARIEGEVFDLEVLDADGDVIPELSGGSPDGCDKFGLEVSWLEHPEDDDRDRKRFPDGARVRLPNNSTGTVIHDLGYRVRVAVDGLEGFQPCVPADLILMPPGTPKPDLDEDDGVDEDDGADEKSRYIEVWTEGYSSNGWEARQLICGEFDTFDEAVNLWADSRSNRRTYLRRIAEGHYTYHGARLFNNRKDASRLYERQSFPVGTVVLVSYVDRDDREGVVVSDRPKGVSVTFDGHNSALSFGHSRVTFLFPPRKFFAAGTDVVVTLNKGQMNEESCDGEVIEDTRDIDALIKVLLCTGATVMAERAHLELL